MKNVIIATTLTIASFTSNAVLASEKLTYNDASAFVEVLGDMADQCKYQIQGRGFNKGVNRIECVEFFNILETDQWSKNSKVLLENESSITILDTFRIDRLSKAITYINLRKNAAK